MYYVRRIVEFMGNFVNYIVITDSKLHYKINYRLLLSISLVGVLCTCVPSTTGADYKSKIHRVRGRELSNQIFSICF